VELKKQVASSFCWVFFLVKGGISLNFWKFNEQFLVKKNILSDWGYTPNHETPGKHCLVVECQDLNENIRTRGKWFELNSWNHISVIKTCQAKDMFLMINPIPSMYGIFTYIHLIDFYGKLW